MIPISYNVRSLFVRKATTIASALGVGLVVFVLSSSQMLANGLRKTMGRSGHDDFAFVMRKGAGAELSSGIGQELVGRIKSAPGVKLGSNGQPLAAGEVMLVLALTPLANTAQVTNVAIRGVTENVRELRKEVTLLSGRPPKPGTDEVMIGTRIDGRFAGLKLGQSFVLNKNRKGTVVGVFSADGSAFESEIWADLDTVRSAFGRENMVSSVTVALESASKFDQFKAAMESDKQLGLQAQRQSDYFEKQSEGTAMFVSVLGTGIVIFFSIGAMIGAMITMYAAVQNRKKEIGMLRALGFSRFTIMTSFLFESVALSLLGGVLGVLASLGMGFVEFSMMNFANWSEITFGFEPTPEILISSLIVGAVMGVLGGFLPAIRAASVSPLAAMRE